MEYMSPIDPNVNLRWTEYPDTDFAAMTLADAKAVGLNTLIEMPNTTPLLANMLLLQQRRGELDKLATAIGCDQVEHHRHIILTNDLAQVRRALEWVQHRVQQFDHNCAIQDGLPIADVTYYADTAIADCSERIWRIKGEMGYTGVSIGHFEDSKQFNGTFDYLEPKSHSRVQWPASESDQVFRQLGYARSARFKGTFYIASVSTPETVELVKFWRDTMEPEFEIVMEVTWAHLFLDTEDYTCLGNLMKMDPALRSPEYRSLMLKHVLAGDIDIIASGHAPHTMERKQSPTPPSGIPAIAIWPMGISILHGLEMPRGEIEDMTFYAARRTFKLNVEPQIVNVAYDINRWTKYGHNPFARFHSGHTSV